MFPFPQLLLTSLHIQLHAPSLSKQKHEKQDTPTKMKIKTNRLKTNEILKNRVKTKEKVHKNTTEFILCWPMTPGHAVYPRVWLIHPGTLQRKEYIFPLSWVSVPDSLVRGWDPMFTSLSQSWKPIWPEPEQDCAC